MKLSKLHDSVAEANRVVIQLNFLPADGLGLRQTATIAAGIDSACRTLIRLLDTIDAIEKEIAKRENAEE